MTTFLSKEVQDGIDAARLESLKKSSRLRIFADDLAYPVLRMWNNGFALAADGAPHLRGFVDLYDGAKHLYQCLIITSEEDRGELVFEFKHSTLALHEAPLDFFRDPGAPVALLPSH
jgi:hypothetical protein